MGRDAGYYRAPTGRTASESRGGPVGFLLAPSPPGSAADRRRRSAGAGSGPPGSLKPTPSLPDVHRGSLPCLLSNPRPIPAPLITHVTPQILCELSQACFPAWTHLSISEKPSPRHGGGGVGNTASVNPRPHPSC